MTKQESLSQPKHNQHRIPIKYLKGFFCERKGKPKESLIWIYRWDKPWHPGEHSEKDNPCRTGIHITASEKDAYAFVTPQGRTDFNTFEDLLQKKETKADKILEKLRTRQPISNSEKEIFAEYIQDTYKRTSERDRRTRPLSDKVVTSFPWNSISLQFAMQGDFGNAKRLFEMQKYFESDDGEKWLLNASRVETYPELHAKLVGMKWVFYVAPTETFFVTSNSPVIYERFDARHSMLIFPIASNIALLAKSNSSTDLRYVDASSDETFAINFMFIRITSGGSSPEIYAAKAERWVWQIFNHNLGLDENQERAWRQLIG